MKVLKREVLVEGPSRVIHWLSKFE